jgi:hypothetical protein
MSIAPAGLALLALVGMIGLIVVHRMGPATVLVGLLSGAVLFLLAFGLAKLRSRWVAVTLLIAIGLLLRVIAFKIFVPGGLGGDSRIYLDVAQNIVAGRGHIISETIAPGGQRAAGPPLFPVALAGMLELFGHVRWAALALNCAADLLASGFMYLLARRWGEFAGILAAALYALAPGIIISCVDSSKEPLSMVFLLGGFLALVGLFGPQRWWQPNALAFGAAMAGLALSQPALLPLMPMILLLHAWRVRWPVTAVVRSVAISLLVFGVLMSPWWIRNARLFHEFVPLTTAGPAVLTSIYGDPPGAIPDMRLGEPEARRALGRRAFEHVKRAPIGYLRVVALQAVRTLALSDEPIQATKSFAPAPPDPTENIGFVALQFSYIAMLATAALALGGRGWSRRSSPIVAILIAVAVQIAVFGIWVEFRDRHREYFLPLLALAIASAGIGLRDRWTVGSDEERHHPTVPIS